MPRQPSSLTLKATSLLMAAFLIPAVPEAEDQEGLKREFWVAAPAKNDPERTLLATLQGLANRSRFRLWIRQGGMNKRILQRISKDFTIHELKDVWEALNTFAGEVRGMVVFAAGDDSINAATSLCGPLRAIAVEASLVDRAVAKGLKVLADVRGWDPKRVCRQYKGRFGRGILVEQDPRKSWHLRDFAVARDAFVFWKLPEDDVLRLVRETGPNTTTFGWGENEKRSVKWVSKAGGDYVASDWMVNLSALAKLKTSIPGRPRPPRPAKTTEGERIVAFVMSDGDNLCFVGGNYINDKSFFGSPHRGTFNMTWEMAPRMVDLNPWALRIFYESASKGPFYDDFVTGPSGAGYCFPNHMPNRPEYAKITAGFCRRSDMDIVTLLNDGGNLEQARDMLEQPEVRGVIYKDWAPYNARKGAVWWHKGKPCVSYRYLLWEGMKGQNPVDVAQSIARQPARPTTDPDSYALINVHAWSWKNMGGPMEAVKKTVDRLPPRTRVVTAREFFILLRENFGKPVKKP